MLSIDHSQMREYSYCNIKRTIRTQKPTIYYCILNIISAIVRGDGGGKRSQKLQKKNVQKKEIRKGIVLMFIAQKFHVNNKDDANFKFIAANYLSYIDTKLNL